MTHTSTAAVSRLPERLVSKREIAQVRNSIERPLRNLRPAH